jgi:hypothetical protein
VIALQSDPIFIDAYLAGLNTQLLAELRWRNIPSATGARRSAGSGTGRHLDRCTQRRHRLRGVLTQDSALATRPTWRPAPPAANW